MTIYGFIDRRGKVVSKFRHIHKNWDLLKQMRAEAEDAVKARGKMSNRLMASIS